MPLASDLCLVDSGANCGTDHGLVGCVGSAESWRRGKAGQYRPGSVLALPEGAAGVAPDRGAGGGAGTGDVGPDPGDRRDRRGGGADGGERGCGVGAGAGLTVRVGADLVDVGERRVVEHGGAAGVRAGPDGDGGDAVDMGRDDTGPVRGV